MENELSRDDSDITAGLNVVTHTVCPSPHVPKWYIGEAIRVLMLMHNKTIRNHR